jgi:hypothetical protein
MIDERLAGQDSRLDRIKDKEKRNKKITSQGYTPIILVLGQKVVLQDQKSRLWETKGKVQSIRPGGRSAYISTDKGLYLRNRRFIKIDPEYQQEYIEAVNGVRHRNVSTEEGIRHLALPGRLLCLRAEVPTACRTRVTLRLYSCDQEHRKQACRGITVHPGDSTDQETLRCQCGE